MGGAGSYANEGLNNNTLKEMNEITLRCINLMYNYNNIMNASYARHIIQFEFFRLFSESLKESHAFIVHPSWKFSLFNHC